MIKNKDIELWEDVKNILEEEKTRLVLPTIESYVVKNDFKMLPISLCRYKFAGKMLEGKKQIIEIGCSSGFKTLLLKQFVDNVIGVDFDEDAINFANENFSNDNIRFICKNIMEDESKITKELSDAIVSLDVIEHIEMEKEDIFMKSICNNIHNQGICIIGTPNITANEYASNASKAGHINLYSYDRLKKLVEKYFHNVFLFGMNDEVIHTGFPNMSHYLIAMGVSKK